MNLRTRISRADGYRQLEMFADACMELEMLEGKDRMADAMKRLPRPPLTHQCGDG
jgi:hypothetical protein